MQDGTTARNRRVLGVKIVIEVGLNLVSLFADVIFNLFWEIVDVLCLQNLTKLFVREMFVISNKYIKISRHFGEVALIIILILGRYLKVLTNANIFGRIFIFISCIL
jgi:hypothetical protein